MAKPKESSPAKLPRVKTGDPVLGQRIKDRRKRAGLKLHELGVSKAILSQYEAGTTMPSVSALTLIGEKLGSGVDDLIYGAEAAKFHHQAQHQPTGLEKRIEDLPEAMREFVILALERAEAAVPHVPIQFMHGPTGETWAQFAAYLEALSRVQRE